VNEIACQTYSLRCHTGPEALECARKAGFRAVELWVGHADYRRDPASAPDVRRAAERIGLAIQSYCVGGFAREGVATVERRLAAAFGYAAALGVELVTGVVDRRALPVVDRLCRTTGLRFAVENHWYGDFARAADWREPLGACSPLVGATLDTGHLAAAGDDPTEAAALLGARLFDVHLKDVVVPRRLDRLVWRRPRMEPVALGAGEVPLADLVHALVRMGYEGGLAIEDERPAAPLADLQAALRTCSRWMRAAAPVAVPAEGA
jgi:sugar phosphate isomerase/epimerase